MNIKLTSNYGESVLYPQPHKTYCVLEHYDLDLLLYFKKDDLTIKSDQIKVKKMKEQKNENTKKVSTIKDIFTIN